MIDWHFGDFSASGLALTGCDVLLAIGCLLIAARQHRRPASRGRPGAGTARELVWTLLAAVLFLLAIEHQANLLDIVTDDVRDDAMVRGVYAVRRGVQRETVAGILLGAAVVGGVLAMLARRAGRQAAALAALVTAMAAYLVVKAVSLHAIDRLLFTRLPGIALGNLVELALVAAAAAIVVFTLRSLRAERPRARETPRPVSRRGRR